MASYYHEYLPCQAKLFATRDAPVTRARRAGKLVSATVPRSVGGDVRTMQDLTTMILIRTAEARDVTRLVELNRAAYPDLLEDNVVFDEAQIRSHQAVFPRGQIVAEVDGKIVGAIATLVLPRAIDPLAQHTWMGVTDGGTFVRHDPNGDTLYLADVYVDEAAWGRGVGRALYAALFDLCKAVGCRRVVAGGRLYDFDAHAERMTADEYVARVVRGELRDRVLVSQLRAGFRVKGVLKNYLHDWRSRHFATLLVWDNPAHADVKSAHGKHGAEARRA